MSIPISKYPYTDLHEMNMDFVLEQLKQIVAEISDIEEYGDRITALEDAIAIIEGLVPSDASASNKLTSSNTVTGAISSALASPVNRLDAIESVMPSDATPSNPLVTEDYIAQQGIVAYDGVLTLEKDNSIIGTFTANSNSNITITIPHDALATSTTSGNMSADDFKKINPQVIPASSDLDNYQNVGYYYVADNADAATILNAPIHGNPYGLQVIKSAAGSSEVIQILYQANLPYQYMRTHHNGVWSSWYHADITT